MSGTRPTSEAMASTVAEPVCSVIHQIRANWAILLPSREKACPVQMVKKGGFQLGALSILSHIDHLGFFELTDTARASRFGFCLKIITYGLIFVKSKLTKSIIWTTNVRGWYTKWMTSILREGANSSRSGIRPDRSG